VKLRVRKTEMTAVMLGKKEGRERGAYRRSTPSLHFLVDEKAGEQIIARKCAAIRLRETNSLSFLGGE